MTGNEKNLQVANHKANLQSNAGCRASCGCGSIICALSLSVKLLLPEFTAVGCLSKVCTSEAPSTSQKQDSTGANQLYLSNAHTVSKDRASDLEGVSPRFPLSSFLTPQALLSRPTPHTPFILLTTPPWSPAPNITPEILCSLLLNPWYHFLTLVCAPKHMYKPGPIFCLSPHTSILCALLEFTRTCHFSPSLQSFLVNCNPFICPISSPTKLSGKVTSNFHMANPSG